LVVERVLATIEAHADQFREVLLTLLARRIGELVADLLAGRRGGPTHG
jgi:hypothetical protein